MAIITAALVNTSDSLDTFRLQFNTLRSDVASVASATTITDNESTNEDNALIFTAGGDVDGGDLGLESDGTLTYNPSTGKITATGFVGTLTGDVTGNADTATTLATARTIGGTSFDGSANIAVALATLATTATVSDSNANTNFPVVFNNESNALLDDTGALRYNPSTGTLLVPNLVVAGTTTTVDTVTMEAANAIIFEGATADAHETTLTVIDPTADRTHRLINQSGYIALLAAVTTTAITSTPEELNILDGATVVVGEINALDLGSTAVGIAIASKAVILDSSKDYTGINNLTISGEIDAATGDYSGAVDIAGATTTAAITASGIIKTDDTTAATSTTDGSLQTDGGLSVVLDAVIGDDLFMLSDAAVVTFGADKDVTLTHVADTGLLLNGTSVIQFNDASQNIGAPSATVLDINATDEIELNATLVDVNANLDVSGTYTGAGTMTTGGNIIIPNAGNIGSVGDTDSIAIASNGVVTFSQIPVMPANSIDSDEYIDGSIDRAHLSADIIDATKIADDAIDSEHYTDGSIDTAHIADNQITLAKMAGIARGKIIVGDASGDPSVLTPGNNTQVLSTDGTDLIWADASAASSLAADNLAVGDAAVLLTTSSGNITIDAAANDSDIIFKGTDGGADTTFLTIDGSAAGAAAFNDTVTAVGFIIGSARIFEAELELLDGLTAGTAIASKVVTTDSSIDTTGQRNLTISGILTTGGNIVIPNAGNIGSAGDTDAISISSGGVVNFTARPTFAASLTIQDGGSIGSTSDINALTISSGGVVAVTATTASTNATTGALTVAGGAGIAADLGIGDDLCMISDGSYIYFGVNKEVSLFHRHDKGLMVSDGGALSGTDGDGQVLVRRGADVLLVMNQSAAGGTDAGDNILLDGTDGSATDAGDNITMQNMPFLHTGMQRNVIEIRDSGGQLLNSVAGFAPGAI